jgi:hypothetical protein
MFAQLAATVSPAKPPAPSRRAHDKGRSLSPTHGRHSPTGLYHVVSMPVVRGVFFCAWYGEDSGPCFGPACSGRTRKGVWGGGGMWARSCRCVHRGQVVPPVLGRYRVACSGLRMGYVQQNRGRCARRLPVGGGVPQPGMGLVVARDSVTSVSPASPADPARHQPALVAQTTQVVCLYQGALLWQIPPRGHQRRRFPS